MTERRRARVALGVLVVIGIVVNAAALVLFSRSLDGIRGDFCSYATGVYAATLKLPQVPARLQAEASDVELMRRLDCPGY